MVDDEDLKILERVKRDPVLFAERYFPWGEGELADYTGLRKWQNGVMATIRDHLNGPKRHQPLHVQDMVE